MNSMIKRTLAMFSVLLVMAVLVAGCGTEEEPPAQPVTTTTQTTLPTTTTTCIGGKMEGELNVREGPGSQYASMGGVLLGEAVEIVGREGDWYKIRFGDTYGYINAHYVAVDGMPNASQMQAERPLATTTTAFKQQEGVAGADSVKVYAAPNTSDEAMGELKKDTPITIVGKDGDMYQIEYNGGIGYVPVTDVSKSTTTSSALSTGSGQVTTTTGKNGIPNTNADDVLN